MWPPAGRVQRAWLRQRDSGDETLVADTCWLRRPFVGYETVYLLRQTCASLMAQQGVPVTTAAAIMGHDPAEYLRTYAHLYPDDMRGAAALLDAARTGACGADVVQSLPRRS